MADITRGKILLRRDTTARWNAHPDFIPLKGEAIVYTDRRTLSDGTVIPGIKIGDGMAYCVDLPFIDDGLATQLNTHIYDNDRHTTRAEKEAWNKNVSCELDGETLRLI